MDNRDNELDKLLAPLKNLEVDDLQLKRWENATLRAHKEGRFFPRTHRRQWVIQLAAAVLLGFVMGSLFSGSREDSTSGVAKNTFNFSSDNATYEYSRANLDQ